MSDNRLLYWIVLAVFGGFGLGIILYWIFFELMPKIRYKLRPPGVGRILRSLPLEYLRWLASQEDLPIDVNRLLFEDIKVGGEGERGGDVNV